MYLNTYYSRIGNDRLSGVSHINRDQVEIIQTLTSGGSINVGEHSVPMKRGAVYVIDSALPHCSAPSIMSQYVRSVIIIDRVHFDKLTDACAVRGILKSFYDGGLAVFYPRPKDTDEIQRLFLRMSQLNKGSVQKTDVMLCLLQIIVKLGDCTDISEEQVPRACTADRVIEYLDRNITLGASTKEAAEALHVNKSHLCRVFKESTGMTVTEYLFEKRLSIADRLLANEALTILDISIQAGFSSESYFISQYRKKYGISPGKKRQLMRVTIKTDKQTDAWSD